MIIKENQLDFCNQNIKQNRRSCMILDYSKFERGLNLHGKVAVPEGDSENIITAQLQPNDDGEIPDAE